MRYACIFHCVIVLFNNMPPLPLSQKNINLAKISVGMCTLVLKESPSTGTTQYRFLEKYWRPSKVVQTPKMTSKILDQERAQGLFPLKSP